MTIDYDLKPDAWNRSGWRPLGWAGLLLAMPDEWRLFRVDGDDASGAITLANQEQPCIHLAWARAAPGSRRDPMGVFRRRLRRDRVTGEPAPWHCGPWQGLKVVAEPGQPRRWLGWHEQTRRAVDLTAWPTAAEDEAEWLASSLQDQSIDEAQRWAFFGVSFVAPAGFRYAAAILNLGDMAVVLNSPPAGRIPGCELVVRQIFPASLALKRQALVRWGDSLVEADRKVYRRIFCPDDGAPVDTARGSGMVFRQTLRWPQRLRRWRRTWRRSSWIIHDDEVDRLLVIRIAAPEPMCGQWLEQVLDQMHWARVTRGETGHGRTSADAGSDGAGNPDAASGAGGTADPRPGDLSDHET